MRSRCCLVLAVMFLLLRPAQSSVHAIDPVVQGRILALIRDAAMDSPYAERQMHALAAAETPALAVRRAGEALRRLGMSVSLTASPAAAGPMVADWSGRSFPDQLVLVSSELGVPADAQGLAAAMGVVEVFKRLQLKPRRTMRILAWAGDAPGAPAGTRYREVHRAQLPRHAAVIDSAARSGRPVGLKVRLPAAALPALDPLRLALRPLGADAIELLPDTPASAIPSLQRLGIPGFTPVLESAASAPAADSLRKRVAMLAVLCWLLGEMPEALPRLPAVPES